MLNNNKYISETRKSKHTETFILKKAFDRIYQITTINYIQKIRINNTHFFGIYLHIKYN
jgi:hypothetical protein